MKQWNNRDELNKRFANDACGQKHQLEKIKPDIIVNFVISILW